jgi:hypothetical protein
MIQALMKRSCLIIHLIQNIFFIKIIYFVVIYFIIKEI